LKNAIKSIAVFGISNLLSKVLSSFLIPLLIAKYISKESFASTDIIISFFSLIALLTSLSLESALARYFYNEIKNSSLISSIIFTVGSLSLLFTLISILFSNYISTFFFGNEEYTKLCIIGSLLIFFSNISTITNIYLRFSEKINLFAIISLSQFIIILSYLFLSFKFNTLSSDTIIIAIVLQNLIPVLIIVPLFINKFEFKISLPTLIISLKYSLPLVPITIMVWVNIYLNRFLLQHSKGLQSLSDYMLALKIASIITLIESVFNMFWQPFFLKRFSEKENFKKFEIIFNLLILLFFILFIVSVFIYPQLIDFFYDSKYSISNQYFGLLALTFLINIFNSLIGIGINAMNKTGISSLIFIITSLLGIMMSYILLYYYNTIGLVVSSLILSILNISLTIFFTQKFIKINYNYRSLVIIIFFSIIFYVINSLTQFNLLIKFFFLVIFIILVLFINIKHFTSNTFFMTQFEKFKLKLFNNGTRNIQ
jgi:O-antigen/teichoic acid export membrane protein